MRETPPHIAVLGGTGKEGSGLALRFAKAGYPVTIGSRDAARAAELAGEMSTRLGPSARIEGAGNLDAARKAELVVLCVPHAAQQKTALEVAEALKGKVLIDVTVPLVPPKVSRVQLPGGRSAVELLQERLGPEIRVVSAFQNVSAQHLQDLSHPVDCDILICGDDDAACEAVVKLTQDSGMTAWRAGPLCNSVVTEGLTSVLIAINQRYKIPGAGIRITGIPKQA